MRRAPALLLFLAGLALALPPTQVADDRDDDATLTLTLLDRFIVGDARSFCQVRLRITAEDVPLQDGDDVTIQVFEDDAVGDDLIWERVHRFTAEEVAAQRVDRSFDCTARFPPDPGANAEIYAQAEVRTAGCGFFCLLDRPQTPNLELLQQYDDGTRSLDEDDGDDNPRDAQPAPPGVVRDRIGRDQDWFALELRGPSDVVIDVPHRTAAGPLDAVLLRGDGSDVARGVEDADGARIVASGIAAGSYRLRLSPRNGDDFNYYDLSIRVADAGCPEGAVEAVPCGQCGERRRRCQGDGTWGPQGGCEDEGVCAPGDTRQAPCGNCGTRLIECTPQCVWQDGACSDQGVCQPGMSQREACDPEGSRQRACTEACAWTEWTECSQCDTGAREECYAGPPGTAGVGGCRRGRRECLDGSWSPCLGAVTPVAEECDGRDADCDGLVDEADPDCQRPIAVGDACASDEDCGALTCLRPPANDAWPGGYCSVDGCDEDCPDESECGTIFGRRRCLAACTRPSDCREGYLCADVGLDRLACIPRCRGNGDCLDPALPRCERAEGLCVPDGVDQGPPPPLDQGPGGQDRGAPPTPVADLGPVVRPDQGAPAVAEGPAEAEGCACDAGGGGGGVPLGLLLLGLARGRRRRP